MHGSGMLDIATIANRRRPGTISRSSSSRLPPASAAEWTDRWRFRRDGRGWRPGRAPTGSAAAAKIIGMVDVACFAARAPRLRGTMTSTLTSDELGRDLGKARRCVPRPSDTRSRWCDLDPTEFAQSPARRRRSNGSGCRRAAPRNPMVGTSPAAAPAPRAATPPRAAEKRDELASPHAAPLQSEDRTLPHRVGNAALCITANLAADVSDGSCVTSIAGPNGMRNCTRDEGRPFGFGDQEPIPSHRKLLWSKAVVVSVAEKSGHDPVRHGRGRRAQANRCGSVEMRLGDVKTGG